MRCAWRRARTTVADLIKIIYALNSALVKLVLFGDIFRKFVNGVRDVIGHPMHPRPVRRVRIVDYQGKTARPRRLIRPLQRRRDVRAFTRVLYRNRPTVNE